MSPCSVAHSHAISELTTCQLFFSVKWSVDYQAMVSLEVYSSPVGNHTVTLGATGTCVGTLNCNHEVVDTSISSLHETLDSEKMHNSQRAFN